ADNGLVDVPRASGEETEYGIVCRADRPGVGTRLTHHLMPNMLHIKSSPDDRGSGWTDALAWRVPLDDDTHLSFNVNLMHAPAPARGNDWSLKAPAAPVTNGDALNPRPLPEGEGIVGM